MYNTELLSPAGNLEALIGAVNAGCDAVYLGGEKFGARAFADNFTQEELLRGIRYAHLYGKKVYLAMNTLFKESEMEQVYEYLLPYYMEGLDAVIVQDLGLMQYIKRQFPKLDIHVSTQMTITGSYGANYLKQLGVTRVVPARELSLNEIKSLKEDTGMEVEVFVHGAMCYCYSGQCLFSSILGGRSGNRGRCAQPCRLSYQIKQDGKLSKECHPLSLKDMCTLEHIEDLMDCGIDSFKIEGRMKKPEYAAGVTAIYRKYMDLKRKNPNQKLSYQKKDLEALSKLYIRSERQDGYFYKHNGKDMITLESPAYSGSDEKYLSEIRNKYLSPRKFPVTVYALFNIGEKAQITMIYGDYSVTVSGEVVEEAAKQPITSETIEKQVKKLGDTFFTVEDCYVTTDNHGFYSIKAMNDLRREAIIKLEEEMVAGYGFYRRGLVPEIAFHKKEYMEEWSNNECSILVTSEEQLNALLGTENLLKEMNVNRIYAESQLWLSMPDRMKTASERLCFADFYIALPYIMRKKDEQVIDKLLSIADMNKVKGMLVRNMEAVGYLSVKNYDGNLISDSNLYVWNKETYAFWNDAGYEFTCPVELNGKEITRSFSATSYEKVIYGYLPMMISANCVLKTNGNCRKENKNIAKNTSLLDRYKKDFYVQPDCSFCYNIIYNSVPLSLHGKNLDTYCLNRKRLQFTHENKEQMMDVLMFFRNSVCGVVSNPPYNDFTTGHEKRGVD